MSRMHRLLLLTGALLLSLVLAACGGGNSVASGGVGSGGTGSSVGSMQMAVTDAPSTEFDHVWITIRKVRIHASADAGPDAANWLEYPLAAPVTVDLHALRNGTLYSLFSGIQVPVGTYHQIRFVLAGDREALTDSAQTQALLYNDEVDYSDGSGSNLRAPLEITNPAQGIAVTGSFTVVAGQTLHLAFDFDIGNDVVEFQRLGVNAFMLKAALNYFDLGHAGGISGQIDIASVSSAGAYDIIVKAETLTADGSRHWVVRATSIEPDGSFTLYPLPLPAGESATTVDLVLRGRGMATMVIKDVPVTAGSITSLSPDPVPVAASSEYTANMAAGTLVPSGSTVNFYQTLPLSGEVPYEVISRPANPFTGNFTSAASLAGADLRYGTYVAGGDVVFTTAVPLEGAGSFQAFATAPDFALTAASATVSPPSSGTGPVLFSFSQPLASATGVTLDSVSGSLVQSAGLYDNGYLVLSRGGLIATTLDLGPVLAQNGGAGGAYTLPDLAGGSLALPRPGALYYGYVIVWNSAHPLSTLSVQYFGSFANLGQGSVSGFNLSLQ